jgi:hypothetical protein
MEFLCGCILCAVLIKYLLLVERGEGVGRVVKLGGETLNEPLT